MLKKSEMIELEIEKLVYGGEGLGKYDNFTIFVADTAPGDRIKAEIISVKKNYAQARLKEIIVPSQHRVKPFCPYAKACGGCQWQHIDYEEQLKIKKQIVEESLKKFADLEIPVKNTLPAPETREYRCKVQLPVQQTAVSKRFLAGYYKKSTHEIVNTKYCPVQPAALDEITEFLRHKAQDFNLTAYDEKTKKGLIRHFVYRYSKSNKNFVLTIVINSDKIPENLVNYCKAVKENYINLEGIAVNFNTTQTNLIITDKSQVMEGKNFVIEELGGKIFRISHDAFFQVNPSAALQMFSEVKKMVMEKTNLPDILDIYSGSGGFSVFLSDIANKIIAVEENISSIEDGKENITLNNIKNIEYIKGNADIIIPKLLADKAKFDIIILDPPRKGCSEEVINAAAEITDKFIIYISCNPTTLARDIKILGENFKVIEVQPIDMFCYTYHVETILLAEKK
ncbi:MAG TPA: 23S rRNA (uracil(1939)-C(5))-methyltransferase RlmD [Candidatus Gastranaerophilales bacterium]|nr:23S rRNA (uracil(1939)-C(5))-methyltransferase RlmD [Candidatus Gastranaerophilales bacterium]